jgi:hypothetical protein
MSSKKTPNKLTIELVTENDNLTEDRILETQTSHTKHNAETDDDEPKAHGDSHGHSHGHEGHGHGDEHLHIHNIISPRTAQKQKVKRRVMLGGVCSLLIAAAFVAAFNTFSVSMYHEEDGLCPLYYHREFEDGCNVRTRSESKECD